MKIQELRNNLERRKGQKEQIDQSLNSLRQTVRLNNRQLVQHEQAREVIRTVALETQEQLQYHIGDITSLALEAVFINPYALTAEFVQRRNKTECDLYFERDGERIDPISASGGGAVDVAAFALRIASWSMNHPKTRNVIILDEPMRFLSEAYQEKASMMIKEVSDKLGIQFVIVTHNNILASYADKTFTVSIKKGKSKII
jgi:DNA repair exonuclease SbcCD ATPase subunit